MNDMTVTEVSKIYGVSTRMLRYYEKEGLIESKHKDDYAYRVYDETAIKRLKQILLPDELCADVMKLAKRMAIMLKEKLGCSGINIQSNNEIAAGQTIFHFHVHLIPRYEDDNKSVRSVIALEPRKLTDAELDEIYMQIMQ